MSHETVERRRRLLTVDEVAAALAVSRPTVYRLFQSGQLRPVRVGARWRVPLGQIERLEEPREDGDGLDP
jgi:excisionase family DNA binding protein